MLAIAVDLSGAVPVYRQIANELRSLIARGRLAPGEELPSMRRLGGRIGVNLNTVARAYRLLADEGLVELRHGSGARVLGPGGFRDAALPDAESGRRLDSLLSRWVLAGASRAEISRMLEGALDRYFEPAGTGGGSGRES